MGKKAPSKKQKFIHLKEVALEEILGSAPQRQANSSYPTLSPLDVSKLNYSIIPSDDGTITAEQLLNKIYLTQEILNAMLIRIISTCQIYITSSKNDEEKSLARAIHNLLTLTDATEISARATTNNISLLRQLTLSPEEPVELRTYTLEEEVELLHDMYKLSDVIWEKIMSVTKTSLSRSVEKLANFNHIILYKLTEKMLLLGVNPETLLASMAIDYIPSKELNQLATSTEIVIDTSTNGRVSALMNFLTNSEELYTSAEGRSYAFNMAVALSRADILDRLLKNHLAELQSNKTFFIYTLATAFLRGNYDICTKFLSPEIFPLLTYDEKASIIHLILFRSGTTNGPRLLDFIPKDEISIVLFHKVLPLVTEAESLRVQEVLEPLILKEELSKWDGNVHIFNLNFVYGIIECDKFGSAARWIKYLFDNDALYLSLYKELRTGHKAEQTEQFFAPYLAQLVARRDEILQATNPDFKKLALAIHSLSQKEQMKFIKDNYAKFADAAKAALESKDIVIQEIAQNINRENIAQELIKSYEEETKVSQKPKPKPLSKKTSNEGKKTDQEITEPKAEKTNDHKAITLIALPLPEEDSGPWEKVGEKRKSDTSKTKTSDSPVKNSVSSTAAPNGGKKDTNSPTYFIPKAEAKSVGDQEFSKKPPKTPSQTTLKQKAKTELNKDDSSGKTAASATNTKLIARDVEELPKFQFGSFTTEISSITSEAVPIHDTPGTQSTIPSHVISDLSAKATEDRESLKKTHAQALADDQRVRLLEEKVKQLESQLKEAKDSSGSDSGASAENRVDEAVQMLSAKVEFLEMAISQQPSIFYNPDGSYIQNGITYYPVQSPDPVYGFIPPHLMPYTNTSFSYGAPTQHGSYYSQTYQGGGGDDGGHGSGKGRYKGGKKRAISNNNADKSTESNQQKTDIVNLLGKMFKELSLAIITKLGNKEIIDEERKQYEESLSELKKQSDAAAMSRVEEYADRPIMCNVTTIYDEKAILNVNNIGDVSYSAMMFNAAKLPGQVFNDLHMQHHAY